MANTTNFGWETPDDTDLVKDGAAAMRTLGNSIDASFVDLKGGTSGQILSKNSNTDLDFVWIANDQGDITAVTAGTGLTGGGTTGAVTLTNDMATTITAAGDIVVGTGSGTYDNLPIGTTGQVLTADTTVSPYKVKWATAASGLTFVGCAVYVAANFGVPNNTDSKVAFDSEFYDTDGFHSTTTNTTRLTIPSGKAGKYQVWAWGEFVGNTTGYRQLQIWRNNFAGTPSRFANVSKVGALSGQTFGTSAVADLAVGDYIELVAYQNSGGTLNMYGGANDIQFGLAYLGA